MIWTVLVILIIAALFGFVVFRGSPYVPSHRADIQQAFTELYQVDANDTLVDLGSGDGIILRKAARAGARAVGFEINPILVIISRLLSRNNKISTVFADFWFSHLPNDTTVVYVFSVSRDINKIKIWVQNETNRIGRTIHLISYGSRIDGMKAVKNLNANHLYVFHPLQTNKAQV